MSNVNQANDRKAALIGQLMTLLIIFCSSKVFSKAFFSQLSSSGTRVSLISVASYWAGLLKNRSNVAKRNQLVCLSKYLNKLSKITPHMLVYPPPTFGNYPNYLILTMCKNHQKLSHFLRLPQQVLVQFSFLLKIRNLIFLSKKSSKNRQIEVRSVLLY